MPITSKPAEYFGSSFTTRKAVAAFIDFFTDKIYVRRFDENGNIHAYLKPPIQYSNRERVFDIVRGINNNEFGNSNVTVNNILPRLAIFISGMSYAAERKLNKYEKVEGNTITTNNIKRTLTPVPYKLDVEVSLLTKSIDDMFQIVEQIVPYFTPHLSFELNMLDEFDALPVTYTLSSITPAGEDEYAALDPRLFETIFTFSVDIDYYYIQGDAGIIRDMIINYHNMNPDGSYLKFKSYELNENTVAPTVEMSPEDMDIDVTITDY